MKDGGVHLGKGHLCGKLNGSRVKGEARQMPFCGLQRPII